MPIHVPNTSPCPVPLIGARGLELLFPGGATIGAMMTQLYATEHEIARSLLGQAQLVLAPMKPVFDIIAAVLAVVKILEAVATLNPVTIGKELNNAAKTFAALAKLIPQVSGPIMLAHIIDVVIKVLEGFIIELEKVVVNEQTITRLAEKIISENDPLIAILDCARKMNQARLCAIDESMAPLKPIFDLINVFMRLLGYPPLEPPGPLGHNVFDARTAVQRLVQPLRVIRRGLPIPPLTASPRC